MKKWAIILAVVLLLSLTACGQDAQAPLQNSSSTSMETPASSTDFFKQERKIAKDSAITPEQERYLFDKYIQPYYLAGFMYIPWEHASEIEPNRLIKFFEYNEFLGNLAQVTNSSSQETAIAVSAQEVEDYITGYFDVNVEHLRKADAYDQQGKHYLFSAAGGIGSGPGLAISKVEMAGDVMTLYCNDVVDNQFSVSIRLVNKEEFRYLSGVSSEQIQAPSAPELIGVTKEDVDFLSLEQWTLLEKGSSYIHFFKLSSGHFYNDDYAIAAPEKVINGLTYRKYIGKRYDGWNDFYNDMITVFTPEYFTALNSKNYGASGEADTYINLDDDLYYISADRGVDPTYIRELDRYELIEANDRRI